MERISELHMANYLSNFWGYGNWNSNFWFIGMEEGGGKNFQLVLSKIKSFYEKKFNHHNLVDNYEFQINCIKSPWNSESLVFLGPRPNNKPVKLQSYWSKKIKILLGINNRPTENDEIREFQSKHWGRIHPKNYCLSHAVIELLPLPSPNANDWNYSDWTSHFTGEHCPPLINRLVYKNLILEKRIEIIQEKIRQHKPQIIVLSGSQNNDVYNRIIQSQNWEILNFDGFNCQFHLNEHTLFIKTLAPNTRGITKKYWNCVTIEIAKRIKQLSKSK